MLKYAVLLDDKVLVEIPEEKFLDGLIEYAKDSDIETAFKKLHKDLEKEVRKL